MNRWQLSLHKSVFPHSKKKSACNLRWKSFESWKTSGLAGINRYNCNMVYQNLCVDLYELSKSMYRPQKHIAYYCWFTYPKSCCYPNFYSAHPASSPKQRFGKNQNYTYLRCLPCVKSNCNVSKILQLLMVQS